MELTINMGQVLQAVIIIALGWFGQMVGKMFKTMEEEIGEVKKLVLGARNQVGKINGSLKEVKQWQSLHEKSDDERHHSLTSVIMGQK